MISTFPPAATATPGRPAETQGAHRAPIDGGGDPAVQLVCQLRGGEFVGTTVSGRPRTDARPGRVATPKLSFTAASRPSTLVTLRRYQKCFPTNFGQVSDSQASGM